MTEAERHRARRARMREEKISRGDWIGQGGRNAARTKCPEGHAYTPDNTYLYRGKRQCRTCRRLRARWRQR